MQHAHVHQALDYGCGKLRYSQVLARRCDHLTLVDSAVQIERVQLIAGQRTTIRAWAAANVPNSRVVTAQEFAADQNHYDLVLCSNVLSAIPSYAVRIAVVQTIRDHLERAGHALFVTQFRDTYFSRMRVSDRATPYLDGWLVDSTRGTCFYGLLPPERLAALVARAELTVEKSWKNEKCAYVLARR